jgi:hypothetical protein
LDDAGGDSGQARLGSGGGDIGHRDDGLGDTETGGLGQALLQFSNTSEFAGQADFA